MRAHSVTCLPLAATVGLIGGMTWDELQVGWELLEQHRFFHAMRDVDINNISSADLAARVRAHDKKLFRHTEQFTPPPPIRYEEVPQL